MLTITVSQRKKARALRKLSQMHKALKVTCFFCNGDHVDEHCTSLAARAYSALDAPDTDEAREYIQNSLANFTHGALDKFKIEPASPSQPGTVRVKIKTPARDVYDLYVRIGEKDTE